MFYEHGLHLLLVGGKVALHRVDVPLGARLELVARGTAGASHLRARE